MDCHPPSMDESGVHDGSPVIAVAAYVARPRQWQDWTKRWNVAKRPIKEALAVRAGKKLRGDEHLITGFAATRLRMELDRVPLWRGSNHVSLGPIHSSTSA
jgi:hypothetical protein